jgi:hypothetical protein
VAYSPASNSYPVNSDPKVGSDEVALKWRDKCLARQNRLQLVQKKYFAHNPFILNILQTHSTCKLLKINNFSARYPQRGGGRGDPLNRARPEDNQWPTREIVIASVTKSASHPPSGETSPNGEKPKMLILLLILILVFGFGGYRMGPGLGYYGGGGISLILLIVLILLLMKVI